MEINHYSQLDSPSLSAPASEPWRATSEQMLGMLCTLLSGTTGEYSWKQEGKRPVDTMALIGNVLKGVHLPFITTSILFSKNMHILFMQLFRHAVLGSQCNIFHDVNSFRMEVES